MLTSRYNIGLFDLATDAAFAYDAAYRLFGLKSAQQKNASATTTVNKDGKPDPFDSEEANFVFNWLTYSDEDMMEVESPERMNFTCPSIYRAKRSEELASRLLASTTQEQNAEGLGIISEADLVAKVRKEIKSIAKLAAAICPVQKIFGKRACDLSFDELPEVEVKSRKRSRKPSRDYLIKHQFVHPQQQSRNSSNMSSLQQMLLQQQMYGQGMMGPQIGFGNMFGSLPMNSMGPPPANSHNGLAGFSKEQAAMPNDSVPSSSLGANNPDIPPASGSTYDPQLLYMMMQQNMPHSNGLSVNGQHQIDMPQGSMPTNMMASQVDMSKNLEQHTNSSSQPVSQNMQSNINQVLLPPTRKSPTSPENKESSAL